MIFVAFMSCTKFKGNQEIPAYMCIKPWNMVASDYNRYGANTHAITDAWIYVDGNVQGCFEIRPKENDTSVTIPLLFNGKHKVILYPGIKMNGIASTRIQYPFYRSYVIEDYEFTPGVVDTVQPETKYFDIDEGGIKFKMMEDFESTQLKFSKASNSDTTIVRVSRRPTDVNYNENAWTGDLNHSIYSGQVWLGIDGNDTISKFSIVTDEIYNLPNQGNYILLEMDYKCSAEFEVGMFAKTKNGIETFELVYLRPTDTWKKTYINLGPTVTDNQSASYFKIFIYGAVTAGEHAEYYFDNIKMVYRD